MTKQQEEEEKLSPDLWVVPETLPGEVDLVDVGVDGHVERQGVVVDDAVTHVVQLALDTWHHTNTWPWIL